MSFLWASGFGAQNVLDEGIFSELASDEKQDCADILDEKFFEDGLPRHYRRHRALRIDTDALRTELHSNWTADKDSTDTNGVPIPLFDDLTVLLEVGSWIDQDREMVGVFGTVSGNELAESAFEAYIAEDGKLQMSIRLKDVAFLITQVRDGQCYLIQEFDRNMGPID